MIRPAGMPRAGSRVPRRRRTRTRRAWRPTGSSHFSSADPGPVAGEVVPQHHLLVEHPEVAARDQQPGCLAPGKPPHLLSGCQVVRGRHVVLEPDVVGDRLGHQTDAPHAHAAGYGGADEIRPAGPSLGGVEPPSGLPVEPVRVLRRVDVPHLHVRCAALSGAEQAVCHRFCRHRIPPGETAPCAPGSSPQSRDPGSGRWP